MIEEIISFIRDNGLNIYSLAVKTDQGTKTVRLQPANECNNIYSVTKVFTNTAIGILMDEGKLKLDESLMRYVRRYVTFAYDPIWDCVTIRDALGHKMGLDQGKFDIDLEATRPKEKNYLKFILDYPPVKEIGEFYQYTDSAHYLLSLVIETITGAAADEFILERVLKPLNFMPVGWTRCPMNHMIGATGAYMRPKDLVKLGWTYMNLGEYNGQQIISGKWVDIVEKDGFDFRPQKSSGYIGKAGIFGQMLMYHREKRIVLAWQGYMPAKDSKKLVSYITDEWNV